MSKHQGSYDESIIPMSLNQNLDYDFNCPEARMQHPMPRTPEPVKTQTSNEWKSRPTVAKFHSALDPWWNTILVTSCVIAVLFDPLFFYIPYINEEERCLGINKQVRAAALVFRSVTDVTFLVHIICQLHEAIKFAASSVPKNTKSDLDWESGHRVRMTHFAKEFSRKLSWRSFLTDVASVFPMPQLLIGGMYFNMGGHNYLERRKILNGFLLFQYVPRIYRIYLSSAAVTHSTLWVKGAFNFFLYILASHVLGAFWYFFSIHRELSCWYDSCIDAKIPKSQCTFYCHDKANTIVTKEFNATLGERCILKVPYNVTDPPFDFGIFFDALKNDIQGPMNFPQKFGYCFWWGLHNLSDFGTSLETSTHLWENCFAILISIIGLLLFLYLIGNVQIYLSKATTRAEEVREKIRNKKDDIEKWMIKNGLQDDMKKEIMKNIKQKLEEDINADLEDLFSMLPWYTKKVLKRFLCISILRKVPMLSTVDVKVLKMICDYLKPVNYTENTVVFRMGEPLDRMVFITDGLMWIYATATESGTFGHGTGGQPTSQSMDTNVLKNGDCYGQALLQFASESSLQLPKCTENVKCHTKVEAFVLMIKDLKTIVTNCGDLWPSNNDGSNKDEAADRVAALGQSQQPQGPKKRVSASTVPASSV